MIKSFFKTALRNLSKHKAYSVINFVGLTCGLALALLVLAYVGNETSYDQFHEKADRLYRFGYTVSNGMKIASVPPPLAPPLKSYYPEVEAVARIYGRNVSISLPGSSEAMEETNVMFADSAITGMFSFDFVSGNPKRALTDKYTVIINEEMATKYFGNKYPIGETLIFSGKHAFKVIAVAKDFPENSHIRFNMLVPYDDMYDLQDEITEKVLRANFEVNFSISHSYTYVLLKKGYNADHINATMPEFLKKHAHPKALNGQTFTLMPMVDIHLNSTYEGEPTATNSMTNIYIFMAVGILTLLIAAINYINLSTSQSLTRMKEIGLRKILGSKKSHLILQFLAESFLFCGVSFLMAYVVFYLALPQLNLIAGKNLQFLEVVDGKLMLLSLGLLVLLTALAGAYPAYFVSKFETIGALKGNDHNIVKKQGIRKALVVFQLAIACMLLSGSLFIVSQLNYLQSKPLGYQKEHIINIPLQSQNINGFFQQNDSVFNEKIRTFQDMLLQQTGVRQTTLSSGSPGGGAVYRGTLPEGFTEENMIFAANLSIDYDFLKAFDIELVAGRNFSLDYGTDVQSAFLINETAVKDFNWKTPEAALGKTIDREGKKGVVVGVVRDFNFSSLTTPISPLVLSMDKYAYNTLSIKFENSNIESKIKAISDEWNRFFPEKAFEFTFLDDQLQEQYESFSNFGLIIQSFTGIAMLIACLGVYGLVLFTVQRKTKEIGVRKVLGASVSGILKLVVKDFAVLILLGFVIAIPVSYYFINKWLDNFVYQISISGFTYLVSLGIITCIVAITIGYHSIKAAQTDPVKSLRVE